MLKSCKSKFSAVLFDMDGLLLDTENIALKLFEETIVKAGYKWSEEIGLRMIGRNGQDADALLSAHYGTGFSIVEIRVAFLKSYQAHLLEKGVPVKVGAKELLEDLREQGISCALVTSSRRRITDLKMQGAAIAEYFPVQVCGDEVDKGKPDPQCYLLAAKKLGVPAEQCLVLEDSAPGIEAALAAGMTAWWVPDKVPATAELQKRGAMVFTDLEQVQANLFK